MCSILLSSFEDKFLLKSSDLMSHSSKNPPKGGCSFLCVWDTLFGVKKNEGGWRRDNDV